MQPLFFFMAMKKIILFVLLLACLLPSCHYDERNAEKVAYAYLNALANYKVEEAKQYATPETCQETLTIAENLVAMVDTAYIISDTPAKIEIQELVIVNDTMAHVKYVKNTPIKHNMQGELQLVKRNNKWQAHDMLR